MSLQRVILLSCGSFNPPTIMHLRMFELARDHLQRTGRYQVVGGVISPVHSGYGKKDLASTQHRVAMARLSLTNNTWVKLSNWESSKEVWSRTREVVDYHQSQVDSYLSGNDAIKNTSEWIPENLTNVKGDNGNPQPVKCKLLCGADFLESFNVPNLWNNEDMLTLTRDYGLVVISREGSDPNKSIYTSDILYENQGNIELVREWLSNEISSTRIRRAIRRHESIKYMVPDPVVDYIQKEKLYT